MVPRFSILSAAQLSSAVFQQLTTTMNIDQKPDPSLSSATPKLVLYSFWQSSCAWRVRFALNVKEFEKLNPLHYVPVVVDGDVVVSDSYAILLYLEEKYPGKALLPVDPQLRAINLQKSFEEKFGSEVTSSWVQFHIEKGFLALERLLEKCAAKYATGNEVCLADVFLAPQISVATQRFNIDLVFIIEWPQVLEEH